MGRAIALLLGLAVMLAVVLGVSSAALAGTGVGAVFNLGQSNSVDALSRLVGSTTNPMLRIDNNGTGSALQLLVEPKRPPLTVNADAGKALNLSADELDNKDSAAFLPSEIYEKSVSETVPAGSTSAGGQVNCDSGDVAVSGGYSRTLPVEITSERRIDERFDAETGATNPGGWHVIAENTDESASGTLTVYVNCADRPPLHTSGS